MERTRFRRRFGSDRDVGRAGYQGKATVESRKRREIIED